jgi:hypothetical protein
MVASYVAMSADGSWKEPMHGSGSSADCWFARASALHLLRLLLPRVLLDNAQEAFFKQALIKRSTHGRANFDLLRLRAVLAA